VLRKIVAEADAAAEGDNNDGGSAAYGPHRAVRCAP
jgi:hypothetical protein